MGYAQYGSGDGLPVVNAHGGLACRLDVAAADLVAVEAGIRLISPDRPGVGLSDPQPGRTVGDWARDVTELLDQIDVDRFAVMGWSMGGQYAAALGHALPQRATRVAIIAGALPLTEPGVFDELPTMDRVLTRMSSAGAVARRALVSGDAVRGRRRADTVRATGRAGVGTGRRCRHPRRGVRSVRPDVTRGATATRRRSRGVSGLDAPVGFRSRGACRPGRHMGGDARRTRQSGLAASPHCANPWRYLEYSRRWPLHGAPALPRDLRGASALVKVDASIG